MKWIRTLLFVITVFLSFIFSVNVVQAAGLGGPNVGDYIYEDYEYVTNAQYDRLENINDQIDTGENPQKLYVIILKDPDSVKKFYDENGQSPKGKGITSGIVGNTGVSLYGHDKYYDIDSNSSGDTDFENNYLICNLQDNRIYFNSSDQSYAYLTDLKFWQIKQGLDSKLTSGSIDSRVAAVFQLADRLTPHLEKVAESSKVLHSKSWSDIKSVVNTVLSIIGLIIGILILIAIHNHNKNNPHHGNPGDGLPDESYDAGFDEGYYMGSHDPFM